LAASRGSLWPSDGAWVLLQIVQNQVKLPLPKERSRILARKNMIILLS